MNHVESFDGISTVDDTRDVDLVCALTNHLYVDIALSQSGEHSSSDTDQVTHLLSNQREDSHISMDGHLENKNISTRKIV